MSVAVLVILGLILTIQVSAMVGAVLVFLQIKSRIHELITPPADGELSPVAQITRAMGQDFARAIMVQIKQGLAAPMSSMVRQESAIQQDMTEAAINEQAPGWGALLGLLPKNVQQRVLKNPAAAAALIGLLGKGFGGTPTDGNTKSSVQLRLRNMG
jgi:hypothetical protein